MDLCLSLLSSVTIIIIIVATVFVPTHRCGYLLLLSLLLTWPLPRVILTYILIVLMIILITLLILTLGLVIIIIILILILIILALLIIPTIILNLHIPRILQSL